MLEAIALIIFLAYLIIEIGVGVGMIGGAGWCVLLLARYLSPTFPKAGLLIGGLLGYSFSLLMIVGLVFVPSDAAPALLFLPLVAAMILPVVPIAEVSGGAIGWGVRAVWRLKFNVREGMPPARP
jgi:hypothetical protein